MQVVDIRQIEDKFPEKGGLRDLFDRGPEGAFYVVKFWGDINYSLPENSPAHFGLSTMYVFQTLIFLCG